MKKDTDVDSPLLPRDSITGKPLPRRCTPGYYPGFSTLSQSAFWDHATRRVVVNRVDSPPPLAFFSQEEFAFWTAVFGHLIPQTDRAFDRQIPLVAPLDHRLHMNQTAGYRYETMPQDRDAYRLGREAISEEASHQYGSNFLSLPYREQDLVLKAIHDEKPQAAHEIWNSMSVSRFWQLMMGDAIDAYYAHPWAWDEIGFGGPAYPRAYTRLERGEPEPWEIEEKRYEWMPPEATISDDVEPAAPRHRRDEQRKSTDKS